MTLKEQEVEGKYDFRTAQLFMTQGFATTFGEKALATISEAIDIVVEKYGDKADYLQVFETEDTKFWLIFDEYEDKNIITALLPEEY